MTRNLQRKLNNFLLRILELKCSQFISRDAIVFANIDSVARIIDMKTLDDESINLLRQYPAVDISHLHIGSDLGPVEYIYWRFPDAKGRILPTENKLSSNFQVFADRYVLFPGTLDNTNAFIRNLPNIDLPRPGDDNTKLITLVTGNSEFLVKQSVIALKVLKRSKGEDEAHLAGGSFVFKIPIPISMESTKLLFLLTSCFSSCRIFKPISSIMFCYFLGLDLLDDPITNEVEEILKTKGTKFPLNSKELADEFQDFLKYITEKNKLYLESTLHLLENNIEFDTHKLNLLWNIPGSRSNFII